MTTYYVTKHDPARSDLVVAGVGLKAMTADPVTITGEAAATSGQIYGGAVGLREGETITNIVCSLVGAGATLTRVEFGVHSPDGVLQGSTGDVKGSVAVGLNDFALSEGVPIRNEGMWYLSFIATGGTPPTVEYANPTGIGLRKAATSPARVINLTGQTALVDFDPEDDDGTVLILLGCY